MRRALDGSPGISTYHGQVGYGYFGKHAGYDYPIVRWAVRAPEAGTIVAVYTGRQTVDGGNIVELVGQYTHRFLHLETIDVRVGDTVAEGQQLAITGNSGNVDFHLHHDVRRNGTGWRDAYSNYVDWEALIKTAPQGATEMITTREEANLAYNLLRGYEGISEGEIVGTAGKRSWVEFARTAGPEIKGRESYKKSLEAQVGNLTASINSMQELINGLNSRPTNLQYATVQTQLADKIAELVKTNEALEAEKLKIKEKIVYTHDEATKNQIDTIYRYFIGQFKTFLKYIKK